eukprot:scaffold3385_cov241-Pinguiococcus_pyrenoidosus.AAC.7
MAGRCCWSGSGGGGGGGESESARGSFVGTRRGNGEMLLRHHHLLFVFCFCFLRSLSIASRSGSGSPKAALSSSPCKNSLRRFCCLSSVFKGSSSFLASASSSSCPFSDAPSSRSVPPQWPHVTIKAFFLPLASLPWTLRSRSEQPFDKFRAAPQCLHSVWVISLGRRIPCSVFDHHDSVAESRGEAHEMKSSDHTCRCARAAKLFAALRESTRCVAEAGRELPIFHRKRSRADSTGLTFCSCRALSSTPLSPEELCMENLRVPGTAPETMRGVSLEKSGQFTHREAKYPLERVMYHQMTIVRV